jgi:hypothetical protein
MNSRKKRGIIVAVVAAFALIVAIAGYAYWSTTGSGTGSSTAGTTAAITLHASFSSGIYPGGTKSVSFTADSTNPGNVQVGTVHLASVSFDAGHSTCSAADFTMPDVVENVEIPNGVGSALPNSGTLSFADTASNQDACKGATITLNLTSS